MYIVKLKNVPIMNISDWREIVKKQNNFPDKLKDLKAKLFDILEENHWDFNISSS